MPSILCFNARVPVAHLVRASDRSSEDPGSNPGWTSMSFFTWMNVASVPGLYAGEGVKEPEVQSSPNTEQAETQQQKAIHTEN